MPLETPTVPISDEKSEKINANTNYRYETGLADRDFELWENGFTHNAPELDLRREEVLDPALWEKDDTESTAHMAEPIEEAKPRPTHNEELKTQINYLTDSQCVAAVRSISTTVVAVRQLV